MIFENILNKTQCSKISDAMFLLWAEDALEDEASTQPEHYKNSFGIRDLPEALEYKEYIDNIIKQNYENIVFECAYTRLYQNGSYLKIHLDRPDLDLTLSICTFSNTNKEWPVSVSRNTINPKYFRHGVDKTNAFYEDVKEDIFTPVGWGATFEGRKYPHWRDSLVCGPDEYIVQTFYHWKMIESI